MSTEVREPSAKYLARANFKQTEIGQIPNDWSVASLREVTDAARPISYGIVQTGPNLADGVPCIRVVDIDNGTLNTSGLIYTSKAISSAYKRTVLRAGDLVMPLRGKVGDVVEVGSTLEGANLTRGVALLSIRNGIVGSYCRHALAWPTTRRRLEQSMNGSALQEIPIAALRSFQIALPREEQEQDAIATALSDVDALIAGLERLIAKKRDIKQAVMQQLLTGQTRLPGFKGDWKVDVLGNVAEIKTGPFGSTLHERDYVENGTPIITVEHLGEVGVMHINLPQVSDQDRQRLRAYALSAGDIVFSRVGSVDRNALIRNSEDGWLFSGRLLRVRPDTRKAFAPFLSHQFHGEPFKAAVRSVAVGQTMASLNTRILCGLVVNLPEVQEQTAIATVLSDMDAELSALEARLNKTRAIKQGMMQELLTGRTRLI
jgi:type I restriction enzyme, S subunit